MQILLAILSVLTLSQCGSQKNKASDVKVTITPDIPIVITADVVTPSKTYTAPWFGFNVTLENGADQGFVLVALQAEITSIDSNGTQTVKTSAWSPGMKDETHDTYSCTYSSFGYFPPGSPPQDMGISNAGQNSACPTGALTFIADGNTPPANGTNYRYRVKVKPLGYFVDDQGDPDDRFEKFKYFFTK